MSSTPTLVSSSAPPLATSSKRKEKEIIKPSNVDTPSWNHVKIISLAPGGGGNRVWSCNYCEKQVTGSYFKVKAHLLRLKGKSVAICQSMSDDVAAAVRKEHEDAEKRKANNDIRVRKQSDFLGLPTGTDLSQSKRKRTGSIEQAFNIADRDTADKLCARLFYACALSFNIVRSPQFRKFMAFLAYNKLSGYVPPTYDRLRTTLLAQEKTHINGKLRHIKESWNKKGVFICSDGWTDIQKNPLIIIMAASESGAMFVSATNASGKIGPEHVVQVITDNASNYKAVGGIIKDKYSHIFWTPCVVHSLNLALKKMCDPPENIGAFIHCHWIGLLIKECQAIRNFVVNHDMAHSIFKQYSNLQFLTIAETRFASGIIMVARVFEVRKHLESMIMDDRWKIYRSDGRGLVDNKACEVKMCIVDDSWWDKLEYLLKSTKPILDFIRVADKDLAILHLVYDKWDSMIEEVKGVIFKHEEKDLLVGQSDFFDAIHGILEERWSKSNTPLHFLAHSLVPAYYTDAWLTGGNGAKRVAPHEDEEISINTIKCFKKFFSNPNDVKKVSMEFGQFSSGTGPFGDAFVMEGRTYEDPISWWAKYGASTKLLQALAFKLLSQPASSSCCERNWSTYSQIHNVKRNRLASTRAGDLIFIHANARLLSRRKKSYTKGPTSYWDICGDKFDIDSEMNQLADLSINDHELDLCGSLGCDKRG